MKVATALLLVIFITGNDAQRDFFLSMERGRSTTKSKANAAVACVRSSKCTPNMDEGTALNAGFTYGECPSVAAFEKLRDCIERFGSLADITDVKFSVAPVGISSSLTDSPSTKTSGTVTAQSTAAGSPVEVSSLFPLQWAQQVVGADKAWAAGITGQGVRIAIVDTAVLCDHPDLTLRVDRTLSKSFIRGKTSGCTTSTVNLHGTHVSGLAAAHGGQAGVQHTTIGMAPRATIVPIQVLDDYGRGSLTAVLDGIKHAVSVLADIINLSLGLDSSLTAVQYAAVQDAVGFAHRNGALVIAAAGNSNKDISQVVGFTSVPEVLTVAATGPTQWFPSSLTSAPTCCTGSPTALPAAYDKPSFYTNRGSAVDISAPGGNYIQSLLTSCACSSTYTKVLGPGNPYATQPLRRFEYLAGTSMATPIVSGAAALVIHKFPDLKGKPDLIKQRLMSGSVLLTSLSAQQSPRDYGAGLLDVPIALGL